MSIIQWPVGFSLNTHSKQWKINHRCFRFKTGDVFSERKNFPSSSLKAIFPKLNNFMKLHLNLEKYFVYLSCKSDNYE